MARCRVVRPDVVRLMLVDVHRHELKDLETKVINESDPEKRKALLVEVDACRDRIKQAEDDGDWIEVKRELNAGETRRVFTNLVVNMKAGEKPELNPNQVGKTKILEYVVGWSLVNFDGSPLPFSAGALDSQDQDTYSEIAKAVDLHEERVEQERVERKKIRRTPTTSEVILQSAAS